MKTYIWAMDAGHEWLAVKKQELTDLNIADKITEFSYVKGSTVYLEGDCDAATFINAYTAKFGVAPQTKPGKHWDRWPGRSFARYTATTPAQSNPVQVGVRHLNDYIEQRNRWMAIFNKDEGIKFPLTQAMVDKIISQLDCDLSPENLHCDGEISAAQAQAKYRFYKLVADELADYTYANGLQMRELYEL
jgi:hypothetical protein